MRKEADHIVMPFGRHKGAALASIPDGYLTWLARDCRVIDPRLRKAVRAELDRRRASGLSAEPMPASSATAPGPEEDRPCSPDREAVMQLLSDVVEAGVRVVALGDGVVRFDPPPRQELRSGLLRYAEDIDALARWVRFDSRGLPRITAASTLLAGLRAQGLDVHACPGFRVALHPDAPRHRLLHAACAEVGRELWFRLVLGLPDPDGAELPPLAPDPRDPRPVPRSPAASPAGGEPAPQSALPELRQHVAEQVARLQGRFAGATGRRRESLGRTGCRWMAFEALLDRLLADVEEVDLALLRELVDHCRGRGRRAGRGAARWRGWAQELEAALLIREISGRQAAARAAAV